MKPDSIDLMILHGVKLIIRKVFPAFNLAMNGNIDNLIGVMLRDTLVLLFVGEIVAVIVKRHYDKKKTRLFGMKRND